MMNELYLFLSFLSGALELGCAFAAVTAAPMSWRVFLLPLRTRLATCSTAR